MNYTHTVLLIIIDQSVLHSQITFWSPAVQEGTVSFRSSLLQKQRYVRDSGRQRAMQFDRFLPRNSHFANKNLKLQTLTCLRIMTVCPGMQPRGLVLGWRSPAPI